MMYLTRVVSGKGRGRRIGFPTINMEIPKELAVQHGIYAGRVQIGEKVYPAVVHYGPVPTFAEAEPTLEAYLLDGVVAVEGDVGIELIAYLREILLFDEVNQLAAAIKADIEKAREIFLKS